MSKLSTLPLDVVKRILSYDFRFVIHNGRILQIGRIKTDDERYRLLSIISPKIYEYDNGFLSSSVYISINHTKDMYITYRNFEIQIQVVEYMGEDIGEIEPYELESHTVVIE